MRKERITAVHHLHDGEPFVVFHRGPTSWALYRNPTHASLGRMSQTLNIIGGPYHKLANGWIWYAPADHLFEVQLDETEVHRYTWYVLASNASQATKKALQGDGSLSSSKFVRGTDEDRPIFSVTQVPDEDEPVTTPVEPFTSLPPYMDGLQELLDEMAASERALNGGESR